MTERHLSNCIPIRNYHILYLHHYIISYICFADYILCDFQSQTICGYTKSAESSFEWQWGSYNLVSYLKQFIPTVDHTEGTSNGGYMYTTPCIGPEVEGDIARLNTPKFDVFASTPMKASFYYHMNGANIGTFRVYINEHRSTIQSILAFSVAGSQSDEWYYSCVNLPVYNVSVSLTFSAELGDGCDSVFAVDDVMISSGRCAEHLNEVTCNFEGTNTCSYFSNCTDGSKYQWSRQKQKTPSDSTGPIGDADGNSNGHFLYAESSYGQPGDKTYLSFPFLRSSHPSSLRFSYHMQGDDIGTLDVLSQNTVSSTVTKLWTRSGNQNRFWNKECILLPPDTKQTIFFVATKTSGFNGDIALDNIYVVDQACPASSISCNFEDDDAFACGYINGTYSSPWIPISHQSSNDAAVASSDTGKFLWSTVTDVGTIITSPEILVNTTSCVTFKYYVKLDNRKVEFVLEASNLTSLWSTSHATGNSWLSGQFELSPRDDKIRISLVTHLSNELGIDDIMLVSGECTQLACPGQFSCGSYCIDSSKLCDRVFDCDDRSDEEKLCDRVFDCDDRSDEEKLCDRVFDCDDRSDEEKLCDRVFDCDDRSDEEKLCDRVFDCDDRSDEEKLCDRVFDCDDRSDEEKLCDRVFDCDDRSDEDKLCDRVFDCDDRSDEEKLCDRVFDCDDRSDEEKLCDRVFDCDDRSDEEKLCDRVFDCDDRSDEDKLCDRVFDCDDRSDEDKLCDRVFDCDDRSDEEKLCDRVFDCDDRSDEEKLCDRVFDCDDRSDEEKLCDRVFDCDDRSDEEKLCDRVFDCDDRSDEDKLCDRVFDCDDRSDEEKLCDRVFDCDDRSDEDKLCDRVFDCDDRSDEDKLCDRVFDCDDRSDEEKLCDRVFDCDDRSDEDKLCDRVFDCDDRSDEEKLCDRVFDCDDRSDEEKLCDRVFYCDDRSDEEKLCDRVFDCDDRSDEEKLCDRVFDCDDRSDEKLCDRVFDCDDRSDEEKLCDMYVGITCDFEDPYLCGYYSDYQIFEGKHVIYQDWVYDHTYGDISGTFFGMVTYLYSSLSFKSLPEEVANKSCLTLFYLGNVLQFSFEVTYLDKAMNNSMNISQNIFRDTALKDSANVWKPAQIEVNSGKVEVSFYIYGYSSEIMYFGIDDIKLTAGHCPALNCPPGLSPCHKDGICVKVKVECDKISQCPSGEDEDDCPVSLSCDFEKPYGCGYIFGSLFIYREAFRHYIPSIDHTYRNYSGHYMYFTSSSRQYSTLMSAPFINTNGGCIRFYYNMEGGVSAELKVYKYWGNSRDMVFYANGIFVERDQWVEGWFEIPPGYIRIEFSAYGDVSNLAPSSVAIDDIEFIEGQSCPQLDCENSVNKFACNGSGVCIPEFLTKDGYDDCIDGSDERVILSIDDSTANNTLVSLCTFETPVEAKCQFHNDVGDSRDWRIQTGPTPSDSTGPDSAAVGSFYLYIETSYGDMELGENARFVSNTFSTASQMCMLFYYHMYGSNIGSLEVITETPTGNQSLFYRSGNQGNQWFLQKIYIPASNNFKIVFNAVDGDGYQGDIALDQILLFDQDCDNSSLPNPNVVIQSSVRLVGGKTEASGRLEILGSSTYSPVCAYYWDEDDTKVVCKQLGYRTSRYFSKSEYGKGRPERPFINYQYYCDGTENKLSDCLGKPVACYSYNEAVAIQCTNTECFEGEMSCGDGLNSTCISEKLWCNGNVDCPNAGDETNCATCRYNEYECNNHECVPLINRCDGTPQCPDRSDEFRCVLKNNTNGQVEVYSNLAWTPLCFTNDTILAQFLCSVTGHGPFSSSSRGPVITDGLSATPSSNPYGVITNYMLNQQMTCDALILQCGNIECGVPSVSSTSVGSYILYGNDAVQGEYPWQALLFLDGIVRCGATLIDPYYAITAAHCIEYMNSYRFQIHVGEVKESRMLTSNDHGQRIPVAQAIMHPVYVGSFNSYLSDIAILRLSQPARYNEYVRPACIATEVRTSFDNCYATGWGYREDVQFGNVLADNLQEVKVDINYDIERCNKSIQKLFVIVPASGICVENQNPFTVACNGDSGGPLICQNQYGRWELVGVTSFGVRGCRNDQYPSIYQSVPYHIKWIQDMTGININAGNIPTPPP